MANADEDPAVSRFREYLRINTISLPTPDTEGQQPNYGAALKYLCNQAVEIGLQYQCVEVFPDRPVVVLTWVGQNPALSSIMLNSHMDVVPVFPEHWESDPFGACKRSNGDIVARGSQDMKCVGMWYLEAIRKLKKEGVMLPRTLHVTFVPDEEVGGVYGMGKFVEREEFKRMNVGYCLDEGLANPDNCFTVFYGERVPWWIKITCTGPVGHSSRLMENTAVEKMHKFMSLVLKYREEQVNKLASDPTLTLGDVTSVNMTILKGGVQFNVIPGEMTVCVDFRISPQDSHEELEAALRSWMDSVGGKMEIVLDKRPPDPLTSIDPKDPWWFAFSTAIEKMSSYPVEGDYTVVYSTTIYRICNVGIKTEIFPAGTDSRYVRRMGIPALGFSAMRNTPILLHEHNEFLNERIYLDGIGIYRDIIFNLANVVIE